MSFDGGAPNVAGTGRGKDRTCGLTIALIAAVALSALAFAALIGFAVKRQIRGPSFHRGETPPVAPEHREPNKP